MKIFLDTFRAPYDVPEQRYTHDSSSWHVFRSSKEIMQLIERGSLKAIEVLSIAEDIGIEHSQEVAKYDTYHNDFIQLVFQVGKHVDTNFFVGEIRLHDEDGSRNAISYKQDLFANAVRNKDEAFEASIIYPEPKTLAAVVFSKAYAMRRLPVYDSWYRIHLVPYDKVLANLQSEDSGSFLPIIHNILNKVLMLGVPSQDDQITNSKKRILAIEDISYSQKFAYVSDVFWELLHQYSSGKFSPTHVEHLPLFLYSEVIRLMTYKRSIETLWRSIRVNSSSRIKRDPIDTAKCILVYANEVPDSPHLKVG